MCTLHNTHATHSPGYAYNTVANAIVLATTKKVFLDHTFIPFVLPSTTFFIGRHFSHFQYIENVYNCIFYRSDDIIKKQQCQSM